MRDQPCQINRTGAAWGYTFVPSGGVEDLGLRQYSDPRSVCLREVCRGEGSRVVDGLLGTTVLVSTILDCQVHFYLWIGT